MIKKNNFCASFLLRVDYTVFSDKIRFKFNSLPTFYFLKDDMENDDDDFELKKTLLHYTNYCFGKYVFENLSMYAFATFLDIDYNLKLLKNDDFL